MTSTEISKQDQVTLTLEDAQLFLDALENPPQPNERLVSAFSKHKEWLPH